MESTTKVACRWKSVGFLIGIAAWLSCSPTSAMAQGSQGQNAFCSSSSGCSTTAGSSAFIDASVFATQADTFCSAIYKILQPPTYSAAVIDARSLPGTTGASMTCATGTTPWNNGTLYLNKPSTILLPAGTISISTMWVLPSGTKLIGEGTTTATSSGGAEQTTIQACGSQSCFSGTAMIQFGSVPQCSGISVENLTLNGSNQTLIGIQNS